MNRRLSLLLFLAACRTAVPDEAPVPAQTSSYDAVYFVLVDRFANGDPANDGRIDPSDPQAFHGGDLAGVLAHLDHIASMGFTTVWLSPVYRMRTEKFMGHGAFHGYWVRDIGEVEPRFGTEDELRALADALHARGMKLILDMVYNHVSFDAPLVQEHPDWFHPSLPIEDWDDPTQLVNREVHGLRDLAQEKPEVSQWLRQRSLHWIEAVGPDGFRIDAVRHMPLDWQAETGELLREASPRPFITLGEVFDGDPLRLSRAWTEGGFDEVFDFPLRYAMIDTFCHARPVGRLGAVLSADRAYADPNHLVTFLDNHDVSRVTTECGGDRERVGLALDFLLTARGVPCVYQGTEIGSEGAGEPDNRKDMVFDRHDPLEDRIREGLAQRRAHIALTDGHTRVLSLTDSELVFERVHPEETATVRVTPEAVEVRFGPGREYQAPGLRPVRLEVRRVPAAADEEVLLVGTGAELGGWRPEAGLPLHEVGDTWVLETSLPEEWVMEYKLVLRGPDGALRWQEGENRYAWVGPGEEPLVVHASWSPDPRPRQAERVRPAPRP